MLLNDPLITQIADTIRRSVQPQSNEDLRVCNQLLEESFHKMAEFTPALLILSVSQSVRFF
jgi:4-hydroxy-3-methylbut-2-en-1-yl diphosphate synthase IspG/GcpE